MFVEFEKCKVNISVKTNVIISSIGYHKFTISNHRFFIVTSFRKTILSKIIIAMLRKQPPLPRNQALLRGP
jgi:hypothetical protein